MGIWFLVKQFVIQMPGTMVVWYSDHHLVNRPVLRPPFEYWSAIQMRSGIWITNHLNNEQLKVRYSDVSIIQMLAVQIPTVYF